MFSLLGWDTAHQQWFYICMGDLAHCIRGQRHYSKYIDRFWLKSGFEDIRVYREKKYATV